MQESNLANQTIAAVATAVAPGEGGIAVIRLSGPDAQQAVSEISRFPGAQLWESHRVLYGYVMAADGVERLDEVLVILMVGLLFMTTVPRYVQRPSGEDAKRRPPS